MKKHQVIFSKISFLLKQQFGADLKESEDGNHLAIGDSGVWIACDERELTMGYGLTHTHYDPEYDDIQQAVDRFFNLLTKRKRITVYYKGGFSYKNKTELILNNSEYVDIGTAMTWLFPYWKRTKEKIEFKEHLIDASRIETEIEEIRNLARQQM